MATKTNFTPEEWNRLLGSVLVVTVAVSAAEPSGLWGLLKESMASGRALLEAKTCAGSNALVKAVADELATSEGQSAARESLRAGFAGATQADVKARAIAALRDIGALLDAKAPEDASAFKAWLRQTAERAAEASSEGSFLGFGGVRVSDTEKATLAEISDALRLNA